MSTSTRTDASRSMTLQTASVLPVDNPTLSVWQTSHNTPVAHFHSTPELPPKVTVVIVGSGISAVFAARHLLSTCPGADILVLEARGTCSGATGRNGGHLLPNPYGEEDEVLDFELRNFHHLASLIQQAGIPCDFRRLNGVIGFWNETYFKEAKDELKELRGRRPDLTSLVTLIEDSEQLKKLHLKDAVGAIVQGTAASLSPYKLVTWLWEEMLNKYPNLNLQTDTPVTSIQPSNKSSQPTAWVIHTARGILCTKYLLLMTNGYTAHLLPQFRDLITPLQLTMSALKPPPTSTFTKSLIPHSYGMLGVGPMDRVQGDHLVQQPLESGGQMMFGGARAVVKGNGVGIWDDSYVDETAREHLKKQLRVLLDLRGKEEDAFGLSDELVSDGEWSGIPGYSRDHLPWVGGVPGMNGVFLCAAYSGHGMPNASLCGSHIASLVSAAIRGSSWRDTEHLALDEKDLPRTYAITVERMSRAVSLPMFP